MQIRDASIDDLTAIVAIYNAAIPGRMATADLAPVSVESRRQWFDEHLPGSRPLWVLEEAGEIVAWLSLQAFHIRPAYHATAEVSVYVAPAAQRRGYARKLVARAIERAGQFGIRTLLALIFGHNEPSLALFRSFGFETWGHLPRVAELDGIERDLLILGRRALPSKV
jgi:L-amino acid N-acyltransferase YncA